MDKQAKRKAELQESIKEAKEEEVKLERELDAKVRGAAADVGGDGASAEPKLVDAAKLLSRNFEGLISEVAKGWDDDKRKAALASLGTLLGGGPADSPMGGPGEAGGKSDGKRGAGEACSQGNPAAFREDLLEEGYGEEEADKIIRTFGKRARKSA